MRSGPDSTARLTALFRSRLDDRFDSRPESAPESGPDDRAPTEGDPPPDGGFGPAAGWVPPGPLGAQLWALLRGRMPPRLRGVRIALDRRGVMALVAICALGIGFSVLLAMRGRAHEVAAAPPRTAGTSPAPALLPSLSPLPTAVATSELLVDVEGQVRRPGLVRLPRGARVDEALRAAGGALPGVDTSALNLARLLVDGEQLRVAIPGDPPVAPGSAPASITGQTGPTGSAGASVDLNTATLGELDALPGVGPVTAQHILDWRSQHGRFTGVDQLQEVPGIGPATYASLAPLVHV